MDPQYYFEKRLNGWWICYKTANADDGPFETKEEAEEHLKLVWEME